MRSTNDLNCLRRAEASRVKIFVGTAWMAVIALFAARLAFGLELPCGPLKLTLEADSGRVVGARMGGAELTAPTGVPQSGFALADGPGAKFARLSCQVEERDGAWHWRGSTNGLALECRAVRKAQGVEFAGRVYDPSGENGADHAVTLRFGAPVDLIGWRFDRDLERSKPIRAGVSRGNAIPSAWGRRGFELWPVNAAAGQPGTIGFATRIDEPQFYRVRYDAERKLFTIEFDFALTSIVSKLPRTAPFRFLLIARSDDWGLRGCLESYYETYPELFRRRSDLVGGWFAWGDILHLNPPVSDFGLAYHEGPAGAKAREHDLALGARTFPYIEPLMYQLPMGDLDHRPSREEIEERLELWSKPLSPRPKAHRGQYDREGCAMTLASGARGPDGSLIIGATGQYNWIAGTKWAAQLPLTLDPEIPGGAAELYLRKMREYMKRDDWGEGRYLDSFSSHTRMADYSPEHLKYADHPPVWTEAPDAPGGFLPCQPIAVAAFEYVRELRKMLDKHGKLILVNQYSHGAPTPFHVFDCLGKEHWVAGTGRLLQRYRAVAYQKVVSNLPSNQPISEMQLREFLVYDIFPGGYGRGDWGQEQMRPTYRRVIPLLRLLDKLGWQPVTLAKAEQRGVVVERYGGYDGRPLCFAVFNRLGGKVVRVIVDAKALGLSANAWCRELLDGSPVSWKRSGDRLEIGVGVVSGETKLIAVGDSGGHGEIARMMAEDRMGDVRRCAAELELRHGNPHPQKAALASISTSLSPGELRKLAKRVGRNGALNKRIGELLEDAAYWLAEARAPARRAPQAVSAPAVNVAAAKLPWKEDFSSGLSPERWNLPAKTKSRVEVRDGRLEIELSPKERSVGLSTKRRFNFGEQPLEFRWRFQFNHGGHQWYLMQSVTLAPSPYRGDDYLHFRVDPGINIRLENGDTPPSNYQYSLTPYVKFKTNVPHEVRLLLTGERYYLEVDGRKLGEGPHDLGFTNAVLSLGVYTGHRGHGDTVWWDDIEVKPARWPVGDKM